jgi:transposase
MTLIYQCVGIDISSKSFTACIGTQRTKVDQSFSEVVSFDNNTKGFNQLMRWVKKHYQLDSQLSFLMEATGVYHENLAHHLYRIGKVVHVVLPNTSKHYFLSLNIKSKNDFLDAKILSRFGLEGSHRSWKPAHPAFLKLRNLTRYQVQLQEQKTALRNIKHSKEASHSTEQFILKSNGKLIEQIEKQIKQCRKQIEELLISIPEIWAKVELLLTIKGVAITTIATIVAETQGFEHFRNAKQLASYAGYDVVEKQSGTSINGKTRISKKGNKYIRNALYFPAMVACRFNPDLKAMYLRIIQKKPSKMIGQVAIQRKLLLLMYALWKKNEAFREGYKKEVVQPIKAELHEIVS